MVFTRTKLRQISFINNLSKHQPSSAKPSPVAQPSAAHPADHPASPTWSSGPAKAGLDFDCVEYLGLGIAKPSTFIEYVVFGFTSTLPFILLSRIWGLGFFRTSALGSDGGSYTQKARCFCGVEGSNPNPLKTAHNTKLSRGRGFKSEPS